LHTIQDSGITYKRVKMNNASTLNDNVPAKVVDAALNKERYAALAEACRWGEMDIASVSFPERLLDVTVTARDVNELPSCEACADSLWRIYSLQ